MAVDSEMIPVSNVSAVSEYTAGPGLAGFVRCCESTVRKKATGLL